ncbi:MAG: hypothetical protein WCF67_19550 [Chitinophagaceae bacterium]
MPAKLSPQLEAAIAKLTNNNPAKKKQLKELLALLQAQLADDNKVLILSDKGIEIVSNNPTAIQNYLVDLKDELAEDENELDMLEENDGDYDTGTHGAAGNTKERFDKSFDPDDDTDWGGPQNKKPNKPID